MRDLLESNHTLLLASLLLLPLVFSVSWLLKIGQRESKKEAPTVPVFGNALQFPKQFVQLKFAEWGRKYGPIYSLKVFHQTMVVVCGAKEARELLDKRSASTSSRPPMYIANDLITQGRSVGVMPYSDRWRAVRKIIHQYFTPKMCDEKHQKIQNAESVQMLHDILKDPVGFYDHIRRYTAATVFAIAFGKRTPYFKGPVEAEYHILEPWLQIAETGATPPVDIIPIFKWLPAFMAPWRKQAQHIHDLQEKLYGSLVQEIKERRSRGIEKDTMIDQVFDLQAKDTSGILDDTQINYIAGILLEGGSDTTASLLCSWVLASIAYPDVAAKAQAEVDRICGKDRMPAPTDFEQMPYINMICKELQRWRPVVVDSFPHYSVKEETIGGYTIPKGTTIIGATWAISHDPDRFDNPDEFRPERYAAYPLRSTDYVSAGGEDSRDHWGYGFGRRICVGMHFAERSLFLNVARLAWAFNFTEDASNPIDTTTLNGYTPGYNTAPKEFKCKVGVRHPWVSKIVEQDFAEAQEVFDNYEVYTKV